MCELFEVTKWIFFSVFFSFSVHALFTSVTVYPDSIAGGKALLPTISLFPSSSPPLPSPPHRLVSKSFALHFPTLWPLCQLLLLLLWSGPHLFR